MDDFIIGIYRVALRLFVVVAVISAVFWLWATAEFGFGRALLSAVGMVVGAVLVVGHFITVLALRDATEYQNRLLYKLTEAQEAPRRS